MRYGLLTIFVIGCAGGATSSKPTAPSPPPPAAHDAAPPAARTIDLEMVAAIDAFLAAPTKDAAAQILIRVMNDEGVVVKMPGQIMSLLSGPGIDEDTTGLLLTGFLAGGARPQYASGIKRDDFVASLRGVLAAARSLGVASPQLAEAAARDRTGTLDVWAREWLATHPNESE